MIINDDHLVGAKRRFALLDNVNTLKRLPILALGILCLLLLAEANANILGLGWNWHLRDHLQFALLCLGVTFTIWGLGGKIIPPPRIRGGGQGVGLRLGIAAKLIPITLLAVALRLYQLDTAVHVFVDELHFAEGVTRFWDHGDTFLLAPVNYVAAGPFLFTYLQSWGVSALGNNFAGLRLASVIFGTLTVPALYLLARQLFDRKTGLIAALMLATFPPHIHFSRLAFYNIADPLFGTLAFAFMACALKSRSRVHYTLSGAMLGLTQYFYEGGRLLYPPLLLLWLITLALTNRRLTRNGVLTFILSFVIVAAPIYLMLFGLHKQLTPRLDHKGIGGDYWTALLLSDMNDPIWQGFLRHIAKAFLVFFAIPDQSFYYIGAQPLILGFLVPFFALGLIYALWRWRHPAASLLLLWPLSTALGNILLRESGWVSGYVVAFPALALLIAVGWNTLRILFRKILVGALHITMLLANLLSPQMKRVFLPLSIAMERGPGGEVQDSPTTPITPLARFIPITLGVLVITAALAQPVYYFTQHLPLFNQQVRVDRDAQDALLRARAFSPNIQIHIVGFIVFYEEDAARMLHYLGRDDLKVDLVLFPEDLTPSYLFNLSPDVDHAFFVEPGDAATIRRLNAFFENRITGPQFSPYNVPRDKQFALYYMPRPDRQIAFVGAGLRPAR